MLQAQLVAQLLCCIPLTSVEPVMSWLTSAMPRCEQEDLLAQVHRSSMVLLVQPLYCQKSIISMQ